MNKDNWILVGFVGIWLEISGFQAVARGFVDFGVEKDDQSYLAGFGHFFANENG